MSDEFNAGYVWADEKLTVFLQLVHGTTGNSNKIYPDLFPTPLNLRNLLLKKVPPTAYLDELTPNNRTREVHTNGHFILKNF